ncbi:MAG: class I SAM-dependent methyltransferase [Elusimicrobiales bacterium]
MLMELEQIYTRDYFLNECDGFRTFKSSGGFHLSKRQKRIFRKVLESGARKIIDIGCGRGELALNLAIYGCEVWAVDFSKHAIDIADEIKRRWEIKNGRLNMNIVLKNALMLDFDDGFFDAALMIDVVEHMDYNSSLSIFRQCSKIIKRGGNLFIHTSPGKIFLNYGLEIYKVVAYFMGYRFNNKLKELLPLTLKPPYHITEWSSSMFRKALKECGFKKIDISLWKNPYYAYYFTSNDRFMNLIRAISKIIGWKELFCADIFVSASL